MLIILMALEEGLELQLRFVVLEDMAFISFLTLRVRVLIEHKDLVFLRVFSSLLLVKIGGS